ncbi:ATP-binding protein [Candidatus Pacearchaeota archaeon]|jgi:anti-sigma regulatory factor (Ser/Thr protein kinase)|nr:ATP-binding protein [Candidatus Pacearchaeota archaeon]
MDKLEITYSATSKTPEFARHQIELFLNNLDIHNDDIITAFGEAVTNAWRHGCKEKPGKYIKIVIDWNPKKRYLMIDVRDPGPGFDTSLPFRVEPYKNLTCSGRFLMAKCVDQIEYARIGNIFRCRLFKIL